MHCPFCGANTVVKINTPNGQKFLIQLIGNDNSIGIGNGMKVDLIACGTCKNIWMHDDGLAFTRKEN